jgi:hypothetical protein
VSSVVKLKLGSKNWFEMEVVLFVCRLEHHRGMDQEQKSAACAACELNWRVAAV